MAPRAVPRRALAGLLVAALAATPLAPAAAQERRFVDEPTQGLYLPATPLAGDHDALAIAVNPAGLAFLDAWHLGLAYSGLVEADAEGYGAGLGAYAARPLRLPLLPRLGFGIALEQILPPRIALAPDPGEPLRLSLAASWMWRDDVAVGLAWRHFQDDGGSVLDGVDTVDLGLSARLGARWAVGAVLHDAFTPVVGGVAVQRRWQLEITSRPFATDVLELGLGAQLGERRGDLDASFRLSWRVMRGLWLRGEVAALSRHELVDPAFDSGPTTSGLGLRAALGLEVSLGGGGVSFHVSGGRGLGADEARVLGGGGTVRWSAERLPSIVGHGEYMARVDLTGAYPGPRLTGVLLALRRWERDPDCRAVIIGVDQVKVGWAGAQELRAAVHRLRARGKKVVALLAAGTTRDYYVAAAADVLLLDAGGGLRLAGLAGAALYFKGLLDKLGVLAQFEKIEEYKSAPEAYTREGPTEEAKLVRDSLFDDVFARLVADLAADRKVTKEQVKAWIDGGPYTAAEAGEAGLVDEVVEPADLELALAEALGGQLWPVSSGPPAVRDDRWEYPRVAVIYISGDIVDGKSRVIPVLGQALVGGDTIASAIAWARAQEDVVAIVLRIDSPGGSALASEVMAREVLQTRGVKPIIVSMGDVAASGGYFAAAYGDLVYALPGTITGSIGIFTGKVDLSGLLGKLGLTIDLTKRGARADMESLYRPYTDEERKLIKDKLRYYYGRFIAAVAKGRGLTEDEVDKVARGRVWTGAQAHEVKLVDRMGGVVDAIVEAKRRAGLGDDDKVRIVNLPAPPRSFLGQVLGLVGGQTGGQTGGEGGAAAGDPAARGETGLPWLDALRAQLPASVLVDPGVPQARLPYVIVLE